MIDVLMYENYLAPLISVHFVAITPLLMQILILIPSNVPNQSIEVSLKYHEYENHLKAFIMLNNERSCLPVQRLVATGDGDAV